MQLQLFLLGLLGFATAQIYYTITVYAPDDAGIDGEVIHARDKAFIIGAASPSTYCGLKDPSQCPDGQLTLINSDMSALASAVPGGQFIFVAPDGSIKYSFAHSSLRPPGSRMGGFYQFQVFPAPNSPITVLEWRPDSDPFGLWACPVVAGVPISRQAILKASTASFRGKGCSAVDGVRIQAAGSSFGAWEYT